MVRRLLSVCILSLFVSAAHAGPARLTDEERANPHKVAAFMDDPDDSLGTIGAKVKLLSWIEQQEESGFGEVGSRFAFLAIVLKATKSPVPSVSRKAFFILRTKLRAPSFDPATAGRYHSLVVSLLRAGDIRNEELLPTLPLYFVWLFDAKSNKSASTQDLEKMATNTHRDAYKVELREATLLALTIRKRPMPELLASAQGFLNDNAASVQWLAVKAMTVNDPATERLTGTQMAGILRLITQPSDSTKTAAARAIAEHRWVETSKDPETQADAEISAALAFGAADEKNTLQVRLEFIKALNAIAMSESFSQEALLNVWLDDPIEELRGRSLAYLKRTRLVDPGLQKAIVEKLNLKVNAGQAHVGEAKIKMYESLRELVTTLVRARKHVTTLRAIVETYAHLTNLSSLSEEAASILQKNMQVLEGALRDFYNASKRILPDQPAQLEELKRFFTALKAGQITNEGFMAAAAEIGLSALEDRRPSRSIRPPGYQRGSAQSEEVGEQPASRESDKDQKNASSGVEVPPANAPVATPPKPRAQPSKTPAASTSSEGALPEGLSSVSENAPGSKKNFELLESEDIRDDLKRHLRRIQHATILGLLRNPNSAWRHLQTHRAQMLDPASRHRRYAIVTAELLNILGNYDRVMGWTKPHSGLSNKEFELAQKVIPRLRPILVECLEAVVNRATTLVLSYDKSNRRGNSAQMNRLRNAIWKMDGELTGDAEILRVRVLAYFHPTLEMMETLAKRAKKSKQVLFVDGVKEFLRKNRRSEDAQRILYEFFGEGDWNQKQPEIEPAAAESAQDTVTPSVSQSDESQAESDLQMEQALTQPPAKKVAAPPAAKSQTETSPVTESVQSSATDENLVRGLADMLAADPILVQAAWTYFKTPAVPMQKRLDEGRILAEFAETGLIEDFEIAQGAFELLKDASPEAAGIRWLATRIILGCSDKALSLPPTDPRMIQFLGSCLANMQNPDGNVQLGMQEALLVMQRAKAHAAALSHYKFTCPEQVANKAN